MQITKDMHAGETCIIIGNGPSLNDIPNEFLHAYPTFGTNRIYLREDFTPTYYASVNPLVIEQSIEEISLMDAVKFIRHTLAHKIPGAIPLKSAGFWTFSADPLQFVFEGYTVTYVCMQLAFWMGFSNVLLVGVDHYFETNGKPNEQQKMEGDDPNHFSADYFKGTEWNLPDLENSERAYSIAKRVYNKAGRQIYNCTTRSALDIFPREDWQSWMHE